METKLGLMMSHLSWKEVDVLSLNVFSEGHLKQRKSHVERLDDVAFPG